MSTGTSSGKHAVIRWCKWTYRWLIDFLFWFMPRPAYGNVCKYKYAYEKISIYDKVKNNNEIIIQVHCDLKSQKLIRFDLFDLLYTVGKM